MGPAFVLSFWVVIGGILAVIGALVLGSTSALLTRGAQDGRRRAIRTAALFPFACLAWGIVVLFLHTTINSLVLGREIPFGDSWVAKLPNGYELLMIDTTDNGTLYNPKTQPTNGTVIGDQRDAVAGVRHLHVEGRFMLGASDSVPYFVLDAETGQRKDFASNEELRDAARGLGIEPRFETVERFFILHRDRGHWLDLLAAGLLILPPLVSFWLLLRSVLRLRRQHPTLQSIG